jgi:hypothetical protein
VAQVELSKFIEEWEKSIPALRKAKIYKFLLLLKQFEGLNTY